MIFRLRSIRKGRRADWLSRRPGEADSCLHQLGYEACKYISEETDSGDTGADGSDEGRFDGERSRPDAGRDLRNELFSVAAVGRGEGRATVTMHPRLR